MHRMMEQEKEKAMSGTRHETQPVATIIYDNGSELTGTAVTTSDGSVGIRIPNEFFKTGLLPDGSMPEGVKSVSIRPKHPKGVFPLTDDYELVTKQLTSASKALKGVESQDDIDKMSDAEYQDIANWLEGTQNRKDATSLIGDGVVSCAAMLPGFAYGEANHANADRQRAASIVLATDNVVSGKPTYSLTEALDLTQQTKITVDGLYSGPKASESDQTTTDMKSAIESHGGIFLTQSNGASIDELVRDIQSRRDTDVENKAKSSMVDAPGRWTLALAVILIIWIVCAWRLRR